MPRRYIGRSFLVFGLGFLAVAFAVTPSYGQRKNRVGSRPLAKQKLKTPVPAYLKSPFDPAVSALGRDFVGHDPVALFAGLFDLAQVEKKGEYETTAQFKDRLISLTNTPLFGSLTRKSLVAFPLTVSDTTYDADNGTLTLTLSQSLIQESDMDEVRRWDTRIRSAKSIIASDPIPMALRLRSYSQNEFTYLAQNVLGVTVRVHNADHYVYSVLAKNWRRFDWSDRAYIDTSRPGGGLSVRLKVSPSNAAMIRSQIGAVGVFRLVSPFATAVYRQSLPDIRHAVQGRFETRNIHAELVELLIYDKTSGEIYKRFDDIMAFAEQYGLDDRSLRRELEQFAAIEPDSKTILARFFDAGDTEFAGRFSPDSVSLLASRLRLDEVQPVVAKLPSGFLKEKLSTVIALLSSIDGPELDHRYQQTRSQYLAARLYRELAGFEMSAAAPLLNAPMKLISRPRPDMPRSICDLAKSGQDITVSVDVTFLASGQIGDVVVKGGDAPTKLADEVVRVARLIKFEPARTDGAPTTVTRRLQYVFSCY